MPADVERNDFVQCAVIDNRRQQSVRAARQCGIHIGCLLLDRTLSLGKDHLAIRLDLFASVFKTLLDRLPECI